MANPHNGEVEFDAGGTKYKLRFSADAICNIEDKLDLVLSKIGDSIQNPETLRMGTIKVMFRAALQDCQPDLDDAKADAVFRTLLPNEAMALVAKAFARSFGADEEAAAGTAANPPQPGNPASGTGPASTPTG